MDLTRFFFDCHAATHASDVYEGRSPGADRWLDGLSDDQLRIRPAARMNSIVWLLWHMARMSPSTSSSPRAPRYSTMAGPGG